MSNQITVLVYGLNHNIYYTCIQSVTDHLTNAITFVLPIFFTLFFPFSS